MSLWSAINSVHTRHATIFVGFSQASPKTATMPAPALVTSVMWPRGGRGQFREQHRGETQRGGGAWPEQAGLTKKYAALARQLRLVKTLPSQHFCAQLLLISTNSSDSSCDGIQFQKLAYVFEWLHIIKASSKIGDRKLPSSEGEIEKMLLNWCLFAHGRDSMEIHLTTFTFRWKEERNKRLCVHYGE